LSLLHWPDFWRALAALVVEAAVGYPDWLHRVLPHPVVWVGRAISGLEGRWNQPGFLPVWRRVLGVLTLVLVAGAAALCGLVIDHVAAHHLWLAVATILLATTGLAQKSLYAHVADVDRALRAGDLPGARKAVARIVGRDVAGLDAGGVSAAALESLAESFCDGVVAPAFWLLFGGLGGLFAYKAVNTADSLIGHMEPRWRAFGWFSARVDDVLNYVPARLAGGLLGVAGRGGWRVMWRDAGKHASPNAGWPEAAMAGALRVQLGGPVSYEGQRSLRPWFGDGRPPEAADIGRGLRLYRAACLLFWGLLAVGGVVWRH
jgi:adenosylcobinamide-phosphate synthase